MDITTANINAITAELKTAYSDYIKTVDPHYKMLAQVVQSTRGETFYPRLKELPGLREWIGQRIVNRIEAGDKFTIVNRTYEETVGARREDIEDDAYDFLAIAVRQLADDAAHHPDKLVFNLLENGHRQHGIDGQYFFDTDHEGYDRHGNPTSFSNILRPAAGEATVPAWYLFNNKQPMRALIYQERRPYSLTAKTAINDDNVFFHNEFLWGVDGRGAAGYGLHNFALRSTAPLTVDNVTKAVAMMQSQYRRDGVPYNVEPDQLVVPVALQAEARRLINGEFVPEATPQGVVTSSNPWKGSMSLLVCPYLSSIVRND